MPTPQANETFFKTLHERFDNRVTRAAVPFAIAFGSLSLAACAQEATPTPSPTAEVEVKTLDQYVEELTQYKDPSELQLPVGASADEFGRWVTELDQKWAYASCDLSDEVFNASLMLTDPSELYPKIAESNGKTLAVAMWGSAWGSNQAAKSYHDAAVENNAILINYCVTDTRDEGTREEYVSASQSGQDEQGNPIYSVNVNIIPGPNNTVDQPGPRTYIYDTGVEDNHIIVENIG